MLGGLLAGIATSHHWTVMNHR